jgi:hypothetical protein
LSYPSYLSRHQLFNLKYLKQSTDDGSQQHLTLNLCGSLVVIVCAVKMGSCLSSVHPGPSASFSLPPQLQKKRERVLLLNKMMYSGYNTLCTCSFQPFFRYQYGVATSSDSPFRGAGIEAKPASTKEVFQSLCISHHDHAKCCCDQTIMSST